MAGTAPGGRNEAATTPVRATSEPSDRSTPPGQQHVGHAHGQNAVDGNLADQVDQVRERSGRQAGRWTAPRISAPARAIRPIDAGRQHSAVKLSLLGSFSLGMAHFMISSCVVCSGLSSAADAAFAHDQDAIAERQNLAHFGGHHEDGLALGRKPPDRWRRFRLWRRCRCPGSARRVSESQDRSAAPWRSPPSAGCRR